MELSERDLAYLRDIAECEYYDPIFPDEDNATCDNCKCLIEDEPYDRCAIKSIQA